MTGCVDYTNNLYIGVRCFVQLPQFDCFDDRNIGNQ